MLRGWTPEHFRLASPDLRAVACWALYAEKAVVMLHDAQETAAMPLKGASADAIRAKVASAAFVNALRPVLFPED